MILSTNLLACFHVLGYIINIAAKMTAFARPSQIRFGHIYSIHTTSFNKSFQEALTLYNNMFKWVNG